MTKKKEIFDSKYYKGMKNHLKYCGLWPYDNRLKKYVIRTLYMVTLVAFLLALLFRFIEEWGRNIDIIIEIITNFLYFMNCFMKFWGYIYWTSKMSFLYEKIEEQIATITDKAEKDIMDDYAKAGQKKGFIYMVILRGALCCYILLPTEPILMNYFKPLESGPRQKTFPYYAKYFIDDQKYYYQLAMHGLIASSMSVQVYTAFDLIYAQCVQHCCSLFAIVECVDIIEESFSGIYFFIILINIGVISFATVTALMGLDREGNSQLLRFGITSFAFSAHMYFNMIPGQMVIDHSLHIQVAAFHSEWYNTSKRVKQLLHIVLLRCKTPCMLTGGQLCILNMENFAALFKTSLSYITIVASMR